MLVRSTSVDYEAQHAILFLDKKNDDPFPGPLAPSNKPAPSEVLNTLRILAITTTQNRIHAWFSFAFVLIKFQIVVLRSEHALFPSVQVTPSLAAHQSFNRRAPASVLRQCDGPSLERGKLHLSRCTVASAGTEQRATGCLGARSTLEGVLRRTADSTRSRTSCCWEEGGPTGFSPASPLHQSSAHEHSLTSS